MFAEAGSDDRERALKDLDGGKLDAVCAVDVFNEGVDVPSIDRVVMLRPTESTVIFLQQLGRGLRAAGPNKTALTVIDFVGNHRIFVERVRTVLALGGSNGLVALRTMLAADGPAELPAGCSVDLELEAKELLSNAVSSPRGGADTESSAPIASCARSASSGDRPRAGELLRMGYSPASLRERHGSWLDFVNARRRSRRAGASRALHGGGGVPARPRDHRDVALVQDGHARGAARTGRPLAKSIDLLDLARRAHAIIRRSPELWARRCRERALGARSSLGVNERAGCAYWRAKPHRSVDLGKAGKAAHGSGSMATASSGTSTLRPWLEAPLARSARELVDYRLAQYRTRQRGFGSVEGFVCKVLRNERDPILKLPSKERAQLPDGEVEVRLPDGSVRLFRFAKHPAPSPSPLLGQRARWAWRRARRACGGDLREWQYNQGLGEPEGRWSLVSDPPPPPTPPATTAIARCGGSEVLGPLVPTILQDLHDALPPRGAAGCRRSRGVTVPTCPPSAAARGGGRRWSVVP